MSQNRDLSEAKRLLLEKCVAGQFTPISRTVPERTQANAEQDVDTDSQTERERMQTAEVKQTSSRDHDLSEESAASENIRSKSFIRQGLNRLLHLICRFAPGATGLRPFLHRIRGARIGKNVWIGEEVYLENEYPERVEIHDGAMVGLRTIILAHTHGVGRIVIGKNTFIGAGSVIVTSSTRTIVIGEGSVIMASSLVNRSVAPYTLYGSDTAKPLAKITRPLANASYEDFVASLRPLGN
jgi:acetyltransferase-like isoleucine patch superfamily enzyme